MTRIVLSYRSYRYFFSNSLYMFSILTQGLDAPVHERYLFKPLRGSSHSWALQQLRGRVTGKKILDVGAGGGGIGRAIRGEHPDHLAAVEIDTRAHSILQSWYDRVEIDLTPISGMRFDWIVLLDIIEHLPDPLEYLIKLRNLLNPGGQLLLSVPNVAHWSVRFPLFFLGRFEPRTLGILDSTHLHFFSRKKFLKLCSSIPEASITSLSATIEPFELALPSWISTNFLYRALLPIRHSIACSLPGLMAYQHLAVIQATSATRPQHRQPLSSKDSMD